MRTCHIPANVYAKALLDKQLSLGHCFFATQVKVAVMLRHTGLMLQCGQVVCIFFCTYEFMELCVSLTVVAAVSIGTSAQCAVLVPRTPRAADRAWLTKGLALRCCAAASLFATEAVLDKIGMPVAVGLLCAYLLMEALACACMAGDADDDAAESEELPASGWEMRPYFHNQSLVVAASMNGGNAIAELVTSLLQWAAFTAAAPSAPSVLSEAQLYAKLEELASSRQYTSTISIKPTFIPERHATDDALAVIAGIGTGALHDPVCLYQALLSGLATNLVDLLPTHIVEGLNSKRVALSGGAVQRSIVLQQALKQALQCADVHVCDELGAGDAAYGAACLHLDLPTHSIDGSAAISLGASLLKEESAAMTQLRSRARRRVSKPKD